MAVVVDSGPIEAEDILRHVPRNKWRELMLARRRFLEVRLSHDCRCLVEFVNDTELMFEALGFDNAEAMIRDGYGLEPKEIEIAIEWLKINKPKEPVSLKVALGKHGGDRKSEKAKDQVGANTNLIANTVPQIRARLRRDDPALAAQVDAGEISADAAAKRKGWRKKRRKLAPIDQIKKLLPKLTADERAELKTLL